jgi:hypothetical protein
LDHRHGGGGRRRGDNEHEDDRPALDHLAEQEDGRNGQCAVKQHEQDEARHGRVEDRPEDAPEAVAPRPAGGTGDPDGREEADAQPGGGRSARRHRRKELVRPARADAARHARIAAHGRQRVPGNQPLVRHLAPEEEGPPQARLPPRVEFVS